MPPYLFASRDISCTSASTGLCFLLFNGEKIVCVHSQFGNDCTATEFLIITDFSEALPRLATSRILLANYNTCSRLELTRREHLKSALYIRLKKRKVFKTVKGGPFRLFRNPVCCKVLKKIRGDTLKTFKNLQKNEKRDI